MRLNKYIAHSGVASRRKADELVEKGLVKINGVTASTGMDVGPGDVVEVDGKIIEPEKKLVYYMLNKPVGYITTASDEQGRPTVLDLMPEVEERIYPVGRLDYMTSGLLIMTNDGDLAYKLMHPSKRVFKTYVAEVGGLLTIHEARRLSAGVKIQGRMTAPAKVEILSQSDSSSRVMISISEGRNRQVRRMFEAVGHRVIRLERISIANLKLGHLKEGRYRKMSQNEIDYLKRL